MRAQAEQVADLPPTAEYYNLRLILIDSYSESSGKPDGRFTPTLEYDNLRLILIDSYSKSSGRPCGKSAPPENVNLRFILIDSYSETSGNLGGRFTLTPENSNL